MSNIGAPPSGVGDAEWLEICAPIGVSCRGCGEPLLCWCGQDADHRADETHSPVVMGCPICREEETTP